MNDEAASPVCCGIQPRAIAKEPKIAQKPKYGFFKDLTRTASALLVSMRLEGGTPMPRPKTHFEQVPLEIVKKIAEKQIATTEPAGGTEKEKLEGGPLKASMFVGGGGRS